MVYRPTVSVLFLVLASIACCCNGFAITQVGGRNRHYLMPPTTAANNHNPSLIHFPSSRTKTSNTAALSLQAKKSKYEISEKESGDEKKLSPATYVLAPFVFIFGLDIVLNILVVTKRSLEVALTGEYTVWTPWQ
mmetsp:Transcript_20530/g.33813  ORF Transcript_20530/g.33813 Transcript_20530/m.33813 type:complete len:135 (-) Transcript_20530:117-521(-)|eukprot:scaffold5273_cov158-Skeletonema_menzelii.AAC.4